MNVMKRFCVILLLSGSVLSAIDVRARQSTAQKRDEGTISVNVDLVNVLFAVTDKNGRFIRDLGQNQFKVFEDGRPQKITNFSADTNLPMTVALLVDTSGSVRDRLKYEQAAALEFFKSTLIRSKDKALVIAFDSAVDLIQDYTDNLALLETSLSKMEVGGATSLYDAIFLAASEKLASQPGRRVIVVISDGDDNQSRVGIYEALLATQRNNVAIFAISTNAKGLGGERNTAGNNILKRLATETGGTAFFPEKFEDLSGNFREITQHLRSQYTLAYQSSNPILNGAFRRIRIDTMDKRYVVKSRNGYYGPRGSSN